MHDESPTQTRPAERVMQGVIPYIGFYGQAGAAADFYIKAFGAKDIGRMPTEGKPGRYMHIQVEINGGVLMLSDHSDADHATTEPFAKGHLQLVLKDGQTWWDRAVAAGCTVESPYERQFRGDDWGLVVDPFGVRWSIMQPGVQG